MNELTIWLLGLTTGTLWGIYVGIHLMFEELKSSDNLYYAKSSTKSRVESVDD